MWKKWSGPNWNLILLPADCICTNKVYLYIKVSKLDIFCVPICCILPKWWWHKLLLNFQDFAFPAVYSRMNKQEIPTYTLNIFYWLSYRWFYASSKMRSLRWLLILVQFVVFGSGKCNEYIKMIIQKVNIFLLKYLK